MAKATATAPKGVYKRWVAPLQGGDWGFLRRETVTAFKTHHNPSNPPNSPTSKLPPEASHHPKAPSKGHSKQKFPAMSRVASPGSPCGRIVFGQKLACRSTLKPEPEYSHSAHRFGSCSGRSSLLPTCYPPTPKPEPEYSHSAHRFGSCPSCSSSLPTCDPLAPKPKHEYSHSAHRFCSCPSRSSSLPT